MTVVCVSADAHHWGPVMLPIILDKYKIMNHNTHKKTVEIDLPMVHLKGDFSIPENMHGLVLFAHGSGSSRLSPRNQMVATHLNDHGLGTLLFDLLTYDEDRDYANRFNIPLLSQRLKDVTEWVWQQKEFESVRTGYFGASTGAAAALMAARDLPQIAAVVSRGGRVDLAMKDLRFVKAPTLLIVGELDTEVLRLNEKAYREILCEKKLEIVADSGHLFEEKGAMEKVAVLAANWFEMHLQSLALYE